MTRLDEIQTRVESMELGYRGLETRVVEISEKMKVMEEKLGFVVYNQKEMTQTLKEIRDMFLSTGIMQNNNVQNSGKVYQATGGDLKQQTSNSGTEELSDPVNNPPQETDIPANKGAEGNGGVDVATGDGVASIPPLSKGEDITELHKKTAAIPNSPSLNEVTTVEKPLIPEQKPSENLLLSKKEHEPLSDALPVFSSKSDKLSSPLFSTSSSVLESAVPKETKLYMSSSANDTTAKANGADKIDYKTTQEVVDVFKKADNAPSTATTSAKAIFSFGLAPPNNATITNELPSIILGTTAMSSSVFAPLVSSGPGFQFGFCGVPSTSAMSGSVSAPSVSSGPGFQFGSSGVPPTSAMSGSVSALSVSFQFGSSGVPSTSALSVSFQFGSSWVPSTSAMSGSVSAPSVSSGPGFQFGSSVVPSTSATSEANVGAKPTEKSLTNEDNKSNGIFGFNPFKSTSNEVQIPALAASSGSTSVFRKRRLVKRNKGSSSMAAQSPSPFQPSSSREYNAGGAGSFSLGTGGTDKSQRRLVKVNKGKLRRK